LIAVSSQDFGMNRRQSIAADAQSVTACTLTPIWQFPTFPSDPEYQLVMDARILALRSRTLR